MGHYKKKSLNAAFVAALMELEHTLVLLQKTNEQVQIDCENVCSVSLCVIVCICVWPCSLAPMQTC